MSNNKILTELPKYIEGTYKGRVNCQAMVGMKLELEYKQNVYIVEIIDYIKGNNRHNRFKIKYNGEIKEIDCGHFMTGQFGGILNKHTSDFKVGVGEIFDNITVVDREYRERKRANRKWIENEKWYKYRCNKCGWDEGWIEEGNLLKGRGCSCCAGKTAVLGINTIWDTDRWMCDLGLSKEDAKTHTRGSGDKVFVVCPKCNKKKEIAIYNIYKYKSIFCSCGDGFSYGHKYIHSMLKQNNIRFEDNVTFNWCKFKDYKKDKIRSGEYDFVIEDIKTIIEVDGGFHRLDNLMNGQTKEESQYIDEMKDKLAREHGYEVIRVYYDDNNLEIKKYILESDIVNIINLNNVDWEECERFALSNRVMEICDYWNNDKKDWETTADLEKIFKIAKVTIRSYLKKGTELGWCNYNGKEELKKVGERCGKVVAMYDLDGNFIMKESSIVKLKERCLKELSIDLNRRCISAVCLGKHKTHKGYIFKYID